MFKILLLSFVLCSSIGAEIIHDSSIEKPIIDPIELDK